MDGQLRRLEGPPPDGALEEVRRHLEAALRGTAEVDLGDFRLAVEAAYSWRREALKFQQIVGGK